MINVALTNALHELCMQLGLNRTYWIAYSGGLDSHVLLDVCSQLQTKLAINLRAVHVNHAVSKHAEQWSHHCEKVCKQYNIPFEHHVLNLNKHNFEEQARIKRYAIFSNCMAKADVLLTAHHQDDQAETVLLQLFRGAGPNGLAAMPKLKAFHPGVHARPLLTFSRVQLEQYAVDHGLIHVEDESNKDIQFARNLIRHQIIPNLKQYWPNMTTMLTRAGEHCAEASELLTEIAHELLANVMGSQANTLSIAKLLQYPTHKQKLLLRVWINSLGFRNPCTKKWGAILQSMLYAARDRMPHIKWLGVELRRYDDDLYVMQPLEKFDSNQLLSWDGIKPLYIDGVGILKSEKKQGSGIKLTQPLSVRFRQGGEKIYIRGQHRNELKTLFQDYRIPTWQRNRIPLIFLNTKLINVVGYFIDPHHTVKQNEIGYEIILEPFSG